MTFYVAVPDVEAALKKAESLGGTRMMGPDKMPEASIEIALFTDPEGHVIGLVKPGSSRKLARARPGASAAEVFSTTIANPWPTPMHIVARP